MLVDLSLQAYFVYLVRANLVVNGLAKYQHLFRANVAMIFLSVSMDVGESGRDDTDHGFLDVFVTVLMKPQITLIGLLSLGNV